MMPDATELKKDFSLGRLNVTTTLGDKDNDGDYDEIYSFGARSFIVWNGYSGKQIYDSQNELNKKPLKPENTMMAEVTIKVQNRKESHWDTLAKESLLLLVWKEPMPLLCMMSPILTTLLLLKYQAPEMHLMDFCLSPQKTAQQEKAYW